MQWKSIKWNDCQEYAILPQFWSSRKTSWLIFDPTAVLSSIDVLEKGVFVHFIFTVFLSLDPCLSILQLHWHQLAISRLQFHILFPLHFSPVSHSPPARMKKKKSLPVGRLQPHLQFCNPSEENFQIHSALSSSWSITERTADLVVISGIPNRSTAIMCYSGTRIYMHASHRTHKASLQLAPAVAFQF